MARTSTGDRFGLELGIGPRGSTKITSENRNEVRQWLRARGCPAEITQRLPVAVLDKAYNDEESFAEMTKVIGQVETAAAAAATATDTQGDTTDMNATAETAGRKARPNRFPGQCEACSEPVAAFSGVLVKEDGKNAVYCALHAPSEAFPPATETNTTVVESRAEPITAAETKVPDTNDHAGQIARAIAAIAGSQKPQLDRDEVTRIVQEEIKRAGSGIAATTVIEVRRDGDLIGKVEGKHHPKFAALLKAATARDASGFSPNVWLAGPAGSGKTRAVHNAAKALNLGFEHNGALAMPHELTGFIDAGGNYHSTAFRNAYENGSVYLFDEVDGSDNAALLALNAALANGEARFPDKAIERHKDTRIFAAANTWGLGATAEFVGRARIDAAFLDRFPVRIMWDYDRELEIAISGNADFARRVQASRAKAVAAGLKVAITPRASIAGAALIAAGFSADEAAAMTYLANLTAEQKRQVA